MFDFSKRKTGILVAVVLALGGGLVGCTATPKEVTAADQVLDAARQAGKDKQCPAEFNAADQLRAEAHALCKPCHTKEAIAKANEAIKKADALCPAKPPTPTPAPAPAPLRAPAATASLSASPTSIQRGQCSTLTWSSTNASSASIDPGVGRVDSSGSRQVCPDQTTQYRMSAVGQGDPGSASATVTVTHVVDRQTLHVNFDFNKATVRKPDDADLQKAIAFIKKYPGAQVSLVGYTDSKGSDEYNLKLSERRAEAVKDYLVKHGVEASRIQTSGKGKADPVASNDTEKGRFQNRRVEVLILSE